MKNRPEFILDCTVREKSHHPTYKEYTALRDNYLKGYFNNHRRNHLITSNIVKI